MRGRSGFLKSEAGGILPFVIGILVLAALFVPALLNLSFESTRSAYRSQEEMQRFYAADVGIEDALFKLSDPTTSVPLPPYDFEDVNGYVVNVSVGKVKEGLYQITSIATKEDEPTTTVKTDVALNELKITSSSGGSVIEPGEGTSLHAAGKTVGYDFDNWTLDTGSIADPNAASTTITMDGDYEIQANFVIPPPGDYCLTVSSTSGGSVANPGEGTFCYTEGWVVDLLALEDSGYAFDIWTGNISNMGDTGASATQIEMYGNYTIVANFVPVYTLFITSTTGGHVSDPGEGIFTYASGTVVDLLAVNDPGYDLAWDLWTGDVGTVADTHSASTTITILGDYAIQANFVSQACRPCFDYAIASLSEEVPLTIDNNGIIDGNIYGNGGIELINMSIIDGHVYSDGDLLMRNVSVIMGNAYVLGDVMLWNNAEVLGNVYADGDVVLKQQAQVWGDVWATGEVKVLAGAEVYGTIHEYCDPSELPLMPTLDPPTDMEVEEARAEYESQAKAGGNLSDNLVIDGVENLGPLYIDGDLNILGEANVTLGGTVYVTGNIDIANNVTIDGSADAIVAEGDIVIHNNSYIETTNILVIMSVYNDIEFWSNGDIYAALYAPNGDVALDNPNSYIYGSVLGETIIAKNNIDVLYNPDLAGNPNLPDCGCPP